MLIDSHAHLNFKAYDADLAEVVARCQEKNMAVINVGSQYHTSQRAAEMALEYPNFYACLGLHPIHVFDEVFDLKAYASLYNDKVVAIGETGFDFFHLTFNRETIGNLSLDEIIAKQREVFIQHIELAKNLNLALILHGRNGIEGRDAYNDILEILQKEKIDKAVFHCFGGSLEMAKKITSAGYYIGIDGPITFDKKAEELQNIGKEIPSTSILIETDSPYLTPVPHRGERNEPAYVEFVAQKIAELKGLTKEEVIEQTWQNAKKLFNI